MTFSDTLKGYAWHRGSYHEPIPASLFPPDLMPDGFIKTLKDIDGCFSVLIQRGDYVLAAVDRVRSRPLFYALKGNELLLGADAFEIHTQLGAPPLDQSALPEFLLTGFVTGNGTLYADIKQMEAGQCLIWQSSTATLQIRDYFRYQHRFEPITKPLPELDALHERVIARLIESAQGRTIVIPLSGGNDSRLIAVMLRRLNYPNVICYTYGSSHLPECQTSRKVAKFLNFPWIMIEQNRRMWYQACQSQEMKRFERLSTHLCTTPHIQDWLAVQALRERKLIPVDSLIVPGHSGDFPEGANLPPILEDKDELTQRDLLNAIFDRHYNLWFCPNDRRNTLFAERLTKQLHIPETMQSEIAASLFDEWDWRNREAKFIINSLRVYEFFGYGWRLPLWDREFLEFWLRVPLEQRLHQSLYAQYKHRYQRFLPPSSNALTLKERLRRKEVEMLYGNLSNSYYGRYADYRDRSAYLHAKVSSLCVPNVSYPDFVNQDLPLLRAQINGLQALVFLRDLVQGKIPPEL